MAKLAQNIIAIQISKAVADNAPDSLEIGDDVTKAVIDNLTKHFGAGTVVEVIKTDEE